MNKLGNKGFIKISLIIVIVFLIFNYLTFEQRTINAIKNRKDRQEEAFVDAVRSRLVKEGYMRSEEEMREK